MLILKKSWLKNISYINIKLFQYLENNLLNNWLKKRRIIKKY